jgi:hypothetical protein
MIIEILLMTNKVKQILDAFDSATVDEILAALDEIKSHFKSDITRDYLQGKIKSIKETNDISEQKKLCKNLLPYFDWYLQGS